MAFFMAGWHRMEETLALMTFEQQWQDGVQYVTLAFRELPAPELARLHELSAELRRQKCAMQALVARVDAASRCAGCGGECCVAGKYHFTRADLLVYLATGETLFAPLFGNGLCPYLGPAGCLAATAYRPFNCITFNCERIEDLLSGEEVAGFYRMERELRRLYREIRSLFPDKSMDGALLAGAPQVTP
jgi:hypothetical protein